MVMVRPTAVGKPNENNGLGRDNSDSAGIENKAQFSALSNQVSDPPPDPFRRIAGPDCGRAGAKADVEQVKSSVETDSTTPASTATENVSAAHASTPTAGDREAAIGAAAKWYSRARRRDCPKPVLPHLQQKFGLSVAEGLEVLKRVSCGWSGRPGGAR